ncbi:hypothetical protein [Jannaschia ovalis]|uniref:Uncharacterized protein n=1 Tax=Jannaschia ovalis TaxID=3038773 RepID=A0ABY8L752_9RHOB|nr:hypothetical protein [Jannaschia sp. GRR-S6-38]WGH77215.1 hypothetical protein P8627_09120 [Jannaschia sp. GRR-S6-38]
MTHVDECRAASGPAQFVEVLEELPVYLMEFQNASSAQSNLSLGKARELILEPADAIQQAQSLMESMLHVLHFATGWLGETDPQCLKAEMSTEMTCLWQNLWRDVDWDLLGSEVGGQAKDAFFKARGEMCALIENLPFEQIRNESEKSLMKLKERLPPNFAQLDEVADKEAVSFVFTCLEKKRAGSHSGSFPARFLEAPRGPCDWRTCWVGIHAVPVRAGQGSAR